jgi:hypothetical protein
LAILKSTGPNLGWGIVAAWENGHAASKTSAQLLTNRERNYEEPLFSSHFFGPFIFYWFASRASRVLESFLWL